MGSTQRLTEPTDLKPRFFGSGRGHESQHWIANRSSGTRGLVHYDCVEPSAQGKTGRPASPLIETGLSFLDCDLTLNAQALNSKFDFVASFEVLRWFETKTNARWRSSRNHIARKQGHEV